MRKINIIILLVLFGCGNRNQSQNNVREALADEREVYLNEKEEELKRQEEAARQAELEKQRLIEAMKQKVRENIYDLLNIHTDYSSATFGGIRNGSFSFENKSGFPIDLMRFEAAIYTANDYLHWSNVYEFTNIKEGDSEYISIPETSRGTYMRVRLVKVESQALDLLYQDDTAYKMSELKE